jgi:putative protein-disulfide isomerase
MNKFIYVYDALCGWCFGFSPVIRKVYETYKDEADFEVISGGMVLHERAGMVDEERATYILSAIPRVEEFTGVKFGDGYKKKLEDRTMFQSSMKPAVALSVFKTYHHKEAVLFATAIQNASFKEGKDLEDDQTYLDLISTTDIDANIFQKQLHNDEFAYAANQDFQHASDMGITGFPALILQRDEQYYLVSRGYQSFDSLQPVIKKVLNL